MAIAIKDLYPGQVTTSDPDYPDGKAQNEATFKDGTGTPFEKQWLNELFGFWACLLRRVDADNEPNGSRERVDASQYVSAIEAMINVVRDALSLRVTSLELNARRPGWFQSVVQGLDSGNFLRWGETSDPSADYTPHDSGTQIEVSRNGYYWVTPALNVLVNNLAPGTSGATADISLTVQVDSTIVMRVRGFFGEDQNHESLSGRALVRITDHASQRIGVKIFADNGSPQIIEGYLAIEPARV